MARPTAPTRRIAEKTPLVSPVTTPLIRAQARSSERAFFVWQIAGVVAMPGGFHRAGGGAPTTVDALVGAALRRDSRQELILSAEEL